MKNEIKVYEILEAYSEGLRSLVSACINKKENDRPTFEEISLQWK